MNEVYLDSKTEINHRKKVFKSFDNFVNKNKDFRDLNNDDKKLVLTNSILLISSANRNKKDKNNENFLYDCVGNCQNNLNTDLGYADLLLGSGALICRMAAGVSPGLGSFVIFSACMGGLSYAYDYQWNYAYNTFGQCYGQC